MLWLACVLLLAPGCASGFSLLVTGDVNLNPALATRNLSYVWGTMLPVLQRADFVAINHESTLAGVELTDPNVIQFEDPLDYLGTYRAGGVDYINQANNHQFDFGLAGLAKTQATLAGLGLAWGGLGTTAADVRTPRVVETAVGTLAFFSMVVDECWRLDNGTLELDACTCGNNAGPPPAYQCYAAGTFPEGGLWYNWGITDEFIAEATAVVGAYQRAHPEQFVVVFLHVGPNFQWQPYPEREQLLRNLSGVSQLVWGTSSHHIQRFEVHGSTPVLFGLGDFLFRHVVGVEDWCPPYAVPCESYRPDLALSYQFDIVRAEGGLRVDLSSMLAWPSQHSSNQTSLLRRPTDLAWVKTVFNELSGPAVTAKYDQQTGAFRLTIN